jgi:SAM-dependent methyltransferase
MIVQREHLYGVMAGHLRDHFRAAARRLFAVRLTAAAVRYIRHQARLRREERIHRKGCESGLPPPHLRYRVHGALDAESYVATGTAIAATVGNILEKSRLPEPSTILDFGCGPGRVVSHLARRHAAWRLFGCDIDPEAIAWARRNLGDMATFEVTDARPPLPFPDRFFDAVYTVSVFTHLDERLQLGWLAELRRILKPGGTLLATTHGVPTFSGCDEHERRELDRRGFVYRTGPTGMLKLDGLPSFYQTTFHTPEYIARMWGTIFEIENHGVGGMAGHQDLVVMRSPGKLRLGGLSNDPR